MTGRVAVVFPFPLEAGHLGKDLLLVPEGLQRLGAQVELHCPSAEAGVDWPVPVVKAGGALDSPAQYAGRGLESAVVFSFLHYSRLLAAVRDAGIRVVAKGDTTGESVVRAHPWPTLRHARFDEPTRAGRARALAAWVARLGPLAGRDRAEIISALELAEKTVVETRSALASVRRSLEWAKRPDLANRIRVVPNPVAAAFTTPEVPVERERLVVAVGRWDLAAKDTPLLAGALERFLDARPDHRAVVIGSGGEGAFGPRVRRVGPTAHAALAEVLGRARVIVTSSHWESFSLSTHEGLAMGCSVAGTALAPIRDISAAGPFGSVARRRTAESLGAAIRAEADAWDDGDRDPRATARWWRQRLTLDAVVGQYADLLDVSGSSG